MNILFLFISYPEDQNSTSLTKDLSDEFTKKGENVYVATIREKKFNLDTELFKENGTNVLRIKNGDMFNNTSKFKKLFTMMTMNNNLLKQIKKYWGNIEFDLIVGTTPYMANSTLVNGLKSHYNCPSFLILWDLFPQNAKDLGLVKNKFIFDFFKRQEVKNLKSFDYIGCMSQGNIKYVKEHYKFLDYEKIILFPLWSKISKIEDVDSSDIRKKYGFYSEDFILIFGGNMGKPQKLENIINLANEVKTNMNIKFLFVGQGTETNRIKNLVQELKLNNVKFINSVPRYDYEKLTYACDIGLVSLDERFTIPNFPSKTIDYLKLGRPILASLDKCAMKDYGEFITKEIKAGLCSEATDLYTMKKNLFKLYNDTEMQKLFSMNGRKFYEKYFNVRNSYNIILDVVDRNG